MTMYNNFTGTAADDMAVQSKNVIGDMSIPHGTGFVCVEWTCLVTAQPTAVADEYNVHLLFTEKNGGRSHDTPTVLMRVGNPDPRRFDLHGMSVPDAHLMATLDRTGPNQLLFCVSYFSIDPASLLGVRNIALNDIETLAINTMS